MENITHRVYMRDWYFNAGIVGFLMIIADGKSLDEVDKSKLSIEENYIEIKDLSILDGFEENFVRHVFLNLFSVDYFRNKIFVSLKKLADQKKKNANTVVRENFGKVVVSFFEVMAYSYDKSDPDKFKNDLELIQTSLSNKTPEKLYKEILNKTNGKDYINDYLGLKTKGIFSYEKVVDYIKSTIVAEKKEKLGDYCISCQERDIGKIEYVDNKGNVKTKDIYLNNTISNVIGFNTDNTNWVWGYKNGNVKLCALCALVYTCAFVSFSYINKKTGDDFLNYMYFLNYNTDLKNLFTQLKAFKLLLKTIANGENKHTSSFYAMIKQSVNIIKKEQSKQIKENINFIEIVENTILGGQSSKGYNVYNYHIDYELATFLDTKLDTLPTGYYMVKKSYFGVDEELLAGVIKKTLSYLDLNRYLTFHVSDMYKTSYSTIKLTKFIFDFINHFRSDGMSNKENIYKKAFSNGIEIKNEIVKKDKSKQIDGIVYRLLNDLKIADKEKFLDKYTRLSLSYGTGVRFGKDEMNDTDCFLQFGYSFINGLLFKEYKNDKNKEQEDNK